MPSPASAVITPPPITIDQVSMDWIRDRREIIQRDGYALRPGAANTIEARSLHQRDPIEGAPHQVNQWYWITLPGGAAAFAHTLERDAVLAALHEGVTS